MNRVRVEDSLSKRMIEKGIPETRSSKDVNVRDKTNDKEKIP